MMPRVTAMSRSSAMRHPAAAELESGGAERSALEIGRALVAAGHRSIVISGGGRMVEQLVAEGSEHVELPIGAQVAAARCAGPRVATRCSPNGAGHRARALALAGLARLVGAARQLTPRPHFVTTVHGLNSPSWYSAIMARGERVDLRVATGCAIMSCSTIRAPIRRACR